jgi:hypothetical protein
MTGVEALVQLYAEKLRETGSHDKAFTKAVWRAYLAGYKDGSTTPENELTPPKWAKEA